MLVGNGVVGTLSGVLVREEIFAEEVDAELEEGALIVAEGLAVVDFFPLEGSGGRSIRTTDLRLQNKNGTVRRRITYKQR